MSVFNCLKNSWNAFFVADAKWEIHYRAFFIISIFLYYFYFASAAIAII